MVYQVVTAHARCRATINQLGILRYNQGIRRRHLEAFVESVINPNIALMSIVERSDSVLGTLQVIIHPEGIFHTDVSLLQGDIG